MIIIEKKNLSEYVRGKPLSEASFIEEYKRCLPSQTALNDEF